MSQPQPAVPVRKPLVCLDFDGVVHAYTSGWQGAAVVPDGCVPGFFEFLRELSTRARVAVYSARSGTLEGRAAMKDAVDRWLDEWRATHPDDIVFPVWDAVRCLEWPTTKPPALVTLDDRCVRFTERWPTVDELLAFRTWQQAPPGAVAAEPPVCSFVQRRAPDGSWHCQSCETGRVVEIKLSGPFLGVPAIEGELPVPPMQTAAARDVLAERLRQREVEGWDAAHDDEHVDFSLAAAAMTYVAAYLRYERRLLRAFWPLSWSWAWFKIKPEETVWRRCLVKAAALLLAEIERLDRAAVRADIGPGA